MSKIDDQIAAERRAETDNFGDEPEEEFPLGVIEPTGAKPPKRNLIPTGVPVSMKASIGKAEVPLRGGFLPDKVTKVIVQCRPKNVQEVALRDEDGKITEGKWRQGLAAIYVEQITPQVLAGLFDELMRAEPAAAGALLDQLNASMTTHASSD